ncbi:MAG: M43 family zinc metalloprotease [Bacteroidia bacterium]
MKPFTKIILVVLFAITWNTMYSQTPSRCATMNHHQWMMLNRPDYAQAWQMRENLIQKWVAGHPNQSNKVSFVPDTIPVVVHVVYKTAAQNISDAQVFSQIDALNEDFGRYNADTVNTPATWQSIAGSMNYRFQFARQDPSGLATNGIVRVSTNDNSFTTDDQIKFDSQGGSDAWDVTTYLNIWVGNLGSFLLGYGEFPTGTPSNTYGFVCHYQAFGRVGAVVAPYDLGRTTTHELSHCFNLFHTWGDDGGSCSGSDQVADTPNQADATTTCYTFPHTDACTTTSPGIMFMNYMDYSYDDCLNMFTQGQTSRMNSALNSFYPTIINSIGLQPPSVLSNDAGISGITIPAATICAAPSMDPIVTIKNWGVNALTSATINYLVDAGTVQTYSWSGNLAQSATASVTLPAIPITGGSHTFTSYTTNPNLGSDPNTSNDTNVTAFTVLSTGQAGTIVEGFELAAFPPAGWTVYNPDNSYTWLRTTSAYNGGLASMYINNYDDTVWGNIDDFTSYNIDLTSINNPQITFYLAYRLYTNPALNPNYSDTLRVMISTDCGASYTTLYDKFGVPLTTTTPSWANNQFTPSASQWRLETISLAPYASSQNAIIKFRNIDQYENNLYIDDINIVSATGINEIKTDPTFSVYPIPAKDKINIQWNAVSGEDITITITNGLGESVYTNQVKNYNGTIIPVDLKGKSGGIYFIKAETADKVIRQKIVLNK